MPPAGEDLVLLGEITGAFGVRGEVRVRPFTATPEGVVAYGPLFDAAGKVVLTPAKWRRVKDALAISAPEVSSREEAEALRGARLHVPREKLPPPGPEEFYDVDLIGCRVESEVGVPLGEVFSVHDFGAGPILEVRHAGSAPLLLPFTHDCAPIVDLPGRRIVARPLDETD